VGAAGWACRKKGWEERSSSSSTLLAQHLASLLARSAIGLRACTSGDLVAVARGLAMFSGDGLCCRYLRICVRCLLRKRCWAGVAATYFYLRSPPPGAASVPGLLGESRRDVANLAARAWAARLNTCSGTDAAGAPLPLHRTTTEYFAMASR